MKDFFISYNKADRKWAEWIAWQLEADNHSVIVQAWDFRPGDNFVLAMQRSASGAERTIAVLSPDFFSSGFGAAEWAAAFAQDPTGQNGILLPVRVRDCQPTGLLPQIVYIDLVDKNESEARAELLSGIKRQRAKPLTAPGFPGSVPAGQRTTTEPPRFPGTLWNVPFRRNPFFTGRDQVLKDLHDALTEDSTAALTQVQAIAGLGGIGKTQAAVEYAYRYRDDYKAIFWIGAESDSSTMAAMVEIARLLDLPEKNAKDAEQTVRAVIRWLESNSGWLLLFDNADQPDHLQQFLPLDPKGHILITSRANAFQALNVARPIRLEVLHPEPALEFLLSRTERQNCDTDEKTAAVNLAMELGYLPLALEQAAAFIFQNSSRFRDYLASYSRRRLELLNLARPIVGDYKESVATTWALNFKQIESASAGSADLLRFSAFLGPDAIPLSLILRGRGHLGPSLSTELLPAQEDPLILDALLQPLTRYSLIRRDTGGQSYSVHRMVQDAIRGQMNQDQRRGWSERAVLALDAALSDVTYGNWPWCELLLPHAVVAARLIDESKIESPGAANLLNKIGAYYHERGRYDKAEPLHKRALAMREQILDPQDLDLAVSLRGLALVYDDQGRYAEAEPLYQRALRIREAVRGPDHPDVAQSLNNLGVLYHNQGKLEDAERLLNRALAVREKALPPLHPQVAQSLNNLALLYHDQERYEEARRLHERALRIREQAPGNDNPDVAQSLSNLALLHYDQGRLEAAEPLYKRALAIWESALGPDHPDVAIGLNNLALLYDQQEKYDEAEPLLKRALDIREKALGPGHPDVAQTLSNLAWLYYEQQRYDSAQPLYERALAIREKALSENDPEVAESLYNLALLHEDQSRFAEAEPLYARALEIREKTLGSDHLETVACRDRLRWVQSAQTSSPDAQ